MQIKYIDIHSHLNLPEFDKDREKIIKQLKDENIVTITVGTDFETSKFAIGLAEKNENLFASVGIHPSDAEGEEFNYQEMLKLAKNNKVVAIGECGLDYFRDENEDTKNSQKELFEKHIKLAIEVGKPLMIHARASKGTMDAYLDTLKILEKYKKENNNFKANFHFFAGNLEIAKRVIDLDFTMSFDGPITFTSDYDEVIKNIPLEKIMAETDAPFAAPVPFRGKICEPQMVKAIYEKIAEIKGLSKEETRLKIVENSRKVFKI